MTGLPAYLQNLPSRDLAQTAIANVGAGSPPYLSIQAGRFTLIDIAGNMLPAQKMDAQGNIYIDVVIVDINNHISKIFFGLNKPYDPDNPTPPICFSDNGIAPSIASGQPQSPTCASCPHNVWGSKISQMGSQVKQCADQQKIALYAPEYSDGLFLLRIPPGSFSNWRAYMAKFAGAGLDPDRVITRISFEQNAVGTLIFHSASYITEQMVGVVAKMIESKAADAMIGRYDRPREGALPQAQPTPALPPPAQQGGFSNGPFPPVASPTPTAGPVAATQQPAAAQQPTQRRRRTKAEMAQARAQAPAAQPQPQQAPFRPDSVPMPGTGPATGAMISPAAAGQQFGIVNNPPAPPPGLDLDSVFK